MKPNAHKHHNITNKKVCKKIIFLLTLLFLSGYLLKAQNYNSYSKKTEDYIYMNEQEYTVYSSDYKEAKIRLENVIHLKSYTLIKQEETKASHYYEFNVPSEDIHLIDSVVSSLGYVSNKQLTSLNNEEKLQAAKIDLAFEENKKEEYEKMLFKIDSVKSEKYYQHWEKTREIENDIAQTKKRIAQLEKVSPIYRVKINVHNEISNPSNTRISFVSMPGFQYSCLITENPKPGISSSFYQGPSLKYLFTKGKSYFTLGILKSAQNNSGDSITYKTKSELFNFAFGQDFYSKRFGRGSRQFLNLYASYQAGVSIFYSPKNTVSIAFANPGLGVELFKNKNILIDCNAYYYLPLSDDINRNMRGLLTNLSFNFVF